MVFTIPAPPVPAEYAANRITARRPYPFRLLFFLTRTFFLRNAQKITAPRNTPTTR
jgi:hypothetical protein